MSTEPDSGARRRRRFDRMVLAMAWKTVAISVMGSALLLAVVRLTLPGIGHYRTDIEHWLSGMLGMPVSIGSLHADWNGWTPELRIENVRLSSEPPRGRAHTVVRFARASFTIDPIASFKRGEIRPGDITVTGATLYLTRRADGAVTFTGLPDDSDAHDAVLPWLLSQRHLQLRSADIVWRDERAGGPPRVFNDVTLALRNDGERHQFDGQFTLPAAIGRRITVALDLTGDLMTPSWSGQVFLDAQRLRPAVWRFLDKRVGLRATGGTSNVKLWSTWHNARLQRVEGVAAVRDTTLESRRGKVKLLSATGNVTVRRTAYGWETDVQRLRLGTVQRRWPQTEVAVSYAEPTGGGAPRVTGRIGFLRLADLLPLLPGDLALPPRVFDPANPANADLSDLHFAFTPKGGRAQDLRLTANFAALHLPAGDHAPGLDHLAGRVEVLGDRGMLAFDGTGFTLSVPGVFAAPLVITHTRGRVLWVRGAHGWHVDTRNLALSNADLGVRVDGGLRWTYGQSAPFLNLVVGVTDGRLERLPAYLPVGVMPEKTSRWLARALPAGRLSAGKVLVRGDLSEFPFDARRGTFEAHLEVSNATLDYDPAWPPMRDMSGTVDFDGRRVRVKVDSGRVFKSHVLTGTGTIDDLAAKEPILLIKAQVHGTTGDVARFLSASPMRSQFTHALGAVDVTGDAALDVDLSVPISPRPNTVRGTLRLLGDRVKVTGLAKGLTDLHGTVSFKGTSLDARELHAKYLGQPVALSLARRPDHGTRIGLRGQADRGLLLAHFRNIGLELESGTGLLVDHLSGSAAFNATLDIPDDMHAPGAVATLDARSDLSGVAVALPAPLAKSRTQARELHVRSQIDGHGRRLISFTYGERLAGVFDVRAAGDGDYRLARGLLRFGSGDGMPTRADLPDKEGVVLQGHIARLPTNQWYALIEHAAGSADTATAVGQAVLDRLLRINVTVGELTVLDYAFADTAFRAHPTAPGHWKVELGGKHIAGEALVPTTPGGGDVVIDLDRLALKPTGADVDSDNYDPRGLPGVAFSCRDLRYGKLRFGTVKFLTAPTADGVAVKQLYVDDKRFHADGHGQWRFDTKSGRARSSFQVQLSAKRIGDILTAFGYDAKAATGGATRVHIDASWPGAPSSFALERINGTLKVTARNGRLLDINPGAAGRVFGLLSLYSLPRRLRLDFGDLFSGGFGFDRIDGTIRLVGGDAYTNDLYVDGGSARIDIAGRTGLVSKDYDELITVTPRLASSLPLAGVVLGPAGVGVGAAIWLTEKLFNKRILDQVVSYQYTVTGPWDNPVVTRVGTERDKSPEKG